MGSYVAMVGLGLVCALAFHVVIRREETVPDSVLGSAIHRLHGESPTVFAELLHIQRLETVTFRPIILRRTLTDGLIFFVSIPASS